MDKPKEDAFNEIIKTNISFTLQEAVFDDESKTATVTMIEEGFSENKTEGNRRFYTRKACEDINKHLSESKKMYLNHGQQEDMGKWAATVLDSSVQELNGKAAVKAKIDFTENPDTVWLYKEAKKHPEQVGLSIDGEGKFREGMIGGTKSAIVEEVTKLYSVDFVTRPAAKGRVNVAESIEDDGNIDLIAEALKTIKQRTEDAENRQKPHREIDQILSSMYEFIYDLKYSKEVEDVEQEIEQAVMEFEEVLIKSVKSIRSKNISEKKTKEQGMKLSELKKDNPEVYTELEADMTAVVEAKVLKDKELEISELTKAKDEAEAKVTEQEATITTQATELEKYKAKEDLAIKRKFIAEKLEELGVSVRESFQKVLEKQTEEEITAILVDFAKEVKESEGTVVGLGKEKVEENVEIKEISTDDLRKKLEL